MNNIAEIKRKYQAQFEDPNVVWVTWQEMKEITGCPITTGFRIGDTWYQVKKDPNARTAEY